MAAKKLIICPKCKSTKVAPHAGGRHEVRYGAVFEATYAEKVCENCGFAGKFFPEVVAERSSARPRKSIAFSRVSRNYLKKYRKRK